MTTRSGLKRIIKRVLWPAGPWIDRGQPRWIPAVICGLLTLACFGASFVFEGAWGALFLLVTAVSLACFGQNMFRPPPRR